jgi:hypothetical protein
VDGTVETLGTRLDADGNGTQRLQDYDVRLSRG